MKLSVLIADDLEIGREQARAALLRVKGHHDFRQQRAQSAETLYDIHEFAIAGQSIEAIEKNSLRPDIAIVDIDFQELNVGYVRDEGFDPGTERTNLRGFDLLKCLETHSPRTMCVLFTGKAHQDEAIYQALRDRGMRMGRSFFTKTDKSIGINELSEHLRDCLESLAINLCEGLPYAERRRVRALLAENAGQIPEDAVLHLGDRPILLRSLLGFDARYEPGRGLVFEDVQAAANRLLPGDRVPGFEPRGWWSLDFVHQAILDWRAAPDYTRLNAQMDSDVANYVLRILLCHQRGKNLDYIGIAEHQSNIGRAERKYATHPAFAQTFHNALKVRRVLLGLSRLSAERIWGQYRNRKEEEVLDFFMHHHHHSIEPENLRNYLTTVRGLSFSYNRPQSINTEAHRILTEEVTWLEKYPTLVLEKLREFEKATLEVIPIEVF